MAEVRTIAVLGAGDMGHGVAELAALKGFEVRLRDVSQDVLDHAMRKVRASMDKLVQKERVTREAAEAAVARIRPTVDLMEAVGQADLVIEAVPEKLDLKQRVFAEVEADAPAHAVFATNTSAMRIREIAGGLKDPSRLVGMHFFNPVLLMDLVEIIPGPATAPAALQAVQDVTKRLGKTAVTLQKDTPGFVTSRLISVWVGAGILAHEHKLGEKEAIDSALRFKAGFPMGPFELADYTGLDVGTHASEYVANRLGEAYRAAPSMRSLVEKGLLGKKTGRGFYEWKDGRMTAAISPEAGRQFDPTLVLAVVANEAAKLVEQGVATPQEIDLAMRHGCAFPKGPLEWADQVGLDVVLKALYTLEEQTGHGLVKPYELLVELVEEGKLGRKTGHGFYSYAPAQAQANAPAASAAAPTQSPESAPASVPAPVVATVAASSGFETILVAVDEASRVGTITLHRPHRLHALTPQMFRELRLALQQLDEDERVRVVLLTGSGDKAFCAGADLQDIGEASPARIADMARQGHKMCLEMEKLGKPVVAAINGVAFGGGLELALPADFRLAARRARFALPEVTLGLLPAMGGTQRLPKLVGLANAKEIAMLGNRIDSETALKLGLVHRVFENDSFEQEARAFAADLATRAPLALRFTKQLLNSAPTTDILAGMEAEAAAFGVLASTEDMLEGVSSMFARKKPEFQGK